MLLWTGYSSNSLIVKKSFLGPSFHIQGVLRIMTVARRLEGCFWFWYNFLYLFVNLNLKEKLWIITKYPWSWHFQNFLCFQYQPKFLISPLICTAQKKIFGNAWTRRMLVSDSRIRHVKIGYQKIQDFKVPLLLLYFVGLPVLYFQQVSRL